MQNNGHWNNIIMFQMILIFSQTMRFLYVQRNHVDCQQ